MTPEPRTSKGRIMQIHKREVTDFHNVVKVCVFLDEEDNNQIIGVAIHDEEGEASSFGDTDHFDTTD